MKRYTYLEDIDGDTRSVIDTNINHICFYRDTNALVNGIMIAHKDCIYGEPIDQLYAYEETGMTPAEIYKMKREFKELNNKYTGLLKKRMKLSETNSDMSDRIGRLESENNKLKNKLEDCERLLNNFHYSSYQKQYEDTKNQLDDVFKTLDDKIIDNAKLKEEVAFYQKQYVDVKKQLDDALEKLDEKNAKTKHDDETMNSMVKDIKELRKENFDFRMNKKKLEHEIKTLDSILNSKHEEVVETRNTLNGLKEENENLKKRIDDLISDASSEFINNCIYETIRRGDSRARIYFENHHVSFTFSPISDKE